MEPQSGAHRHRPSGAAGLVALARASGAPAPAWCALLLIAAIATTLEQLSGYGIDNLTVPLATALLWAQFSQPTAPLTSLTP